MSLDINLTNVQSIPIVVSSSITAENNKVYHVIANATFTDPTPVEGKGYVVLLRNGVATIGGVSNGNLGTIFYRIFRGASWVTYLHYDLTTLQSVFVPPSRTINGLDLSANRTLTTADIADSSNKRYVTDANLTVLGNTSGTNTGDQDLTNLVVKNSAITGATKTKITYDAKGLVTAGADATTADISDSSNKRYVTDANLTVIGNTSGTNSGDETQSTILSKLGFFVKKIGASSTVSTTAETIFSNASIEILGGKLSSTDYLNIKSRVRKTGSNGTYLLRYYLNTTPSTLTGATQIGISTTQTTTSLISANFERDFFIDGGNLYGYPFATANNDGIVSATAVGSVAYNVATTYYIITTITLLSALDTASLIGQKITNF